METTGLDLIVADFSYSAGMVFIAVYRLWAVCPRVSATVSRTLRGQARIEGLVVADSVRAAVGRDILVHICVSGRGGSRQGVFAAAL